MSRVQLKLPDSCTSISLCGGPYNNFAAVEAYLKATQAEAFRFCLGDLGGFGPHPERTIELLKNSNVRCIQGNYDHSVGHGERDCGCGYLDPRDRHFAQLSFDYTFARTSEASREWLRGLPPQIELHWRGRKILLCHGSPFEVNEFVWDSETSNEMILGWLAEAGVDGVCATHSGLPWVRNVGSGKFWLNVGVLGRPAHEGKRHVYHARIDWATGQPSPRPGLVTLDYDVEAVVLAMRTEKLPEEFCQALLTGTWTTCFHILPTEEREVRERGQADLSNLASSTFSTGS